MALVRGRVTKDLESLARVQFVGGREVECLVDTGFTGALVLPARIVDEFRLPIVGHEDHLRTIGGAEISAALALAEIEWLGEVKPVVVIVKDDYLLGAQLLEDTQLAIDYRVRTLTITGGGTISQ